MSEPQKQDDKSRTDNRRLGRHYYLIAVSIFAVMATLSLVNCFIDGFTDERIAMMLLNLWFMLFTMDLTTTRFRRQNERTFWHDWALFSQLDRKNNDKTNETNQNHQSTPEQKTGTDG